MKKNVLFLLSFIFCSALCKAQTPGWLWLDGSGGSSYEYGCGIATDDSGFHYISGRYSGNISFPGASGNVSLLNGTGMTTFVGKFDESGNCLWLSPHYIGWDYPRGLCTDKAKNNNEYVTGNTNSGNGFFIDKFDNLGNLKWSMPLGGSGNGYGGSPNGDAVAADTAGNVYVTGETGGGSWTFGDSTLACGTAGFWPHAQEMFLTKVDKNGNFLWAVGAKDVNPATASYDVGRGVVLDKTATNVFVSGGYENTPSFHSKYPAGDIIAPTAAAGTSSFFVARYDTGGNLIFVATATNAGIPWVSGFNSGVGAVNAVAVDECDNAYVTGYYTGTSVFGPFTITASNTGGQPDGFVASCNSKGQWQWVKDIGSGISTGGDYGQAIVLDKVNDVYVGGTIYGTANFGNGISVTASSTGGSLFLAKYANSTGDVQWAQGPAGTSSTGVAGLAVDTQKFVYIDGTFNGSMTLGSTTINATTNQGNIFIAKLDTVPARYIVPVVDSGYCPGSTSIIPYSLIGTFNTGNVFTAQLSDSTGSFVKAINIGDTLTTTGGAINITIPDTIKPGSNYLIRVVSSNPATSSSVNGCGAYYLKNVYINNFYVNIGGSLTAEVTPADTTACSSFPVQLKATGGSIYSWLPATGLSCYSCANPVATPSATTTYTVNISSGSCPPVNDLVVINVNPSLAISATPRDTSVCSGNAVALNSTGGSTYLWSPGLSLSDSTVANPVATPNVSTTYIVTGGACSTPGQVIVNVGNVAVGGHVSAIRDTICEGTTGSVTLSGNSSNVIQWLSSITGGNFTAINGVTDTTKFKTTPLTQNTWICATVGSAGCSAISDTLELVVPPPLTASFTSTTSGNTVTFNSSGSKGDIRSYYWDFGDNQTSTEANPVHPYTKDSAYNACLTIYDGSNCSYTYCRDVALGVQTVSAEGSWIIYPDPVTNELNIDGKSLNRLVENITVYNVLGQLTLNKVIDNSGLSAFHLNVSSLAKGMYYVVIRTNDTDYVQKVVKQ